MKHKYILYQSYNEYIIFFGTQLVVIWEGQTWFFKVGTEILIPHKTYLCQRYLDLITMRSTAFDHRLSLFTPFIFLSGLSQDLVYARITSPRESWTSAYLLSWVITTNKPLVLVNTAWDAQIISAVWPRTDMVISEL